MPMRSANCHVLLVTCSVFLLGSLCSSREVPMRSEQNVQSQEQVTRTTIDRFNEAFNRHDADGLAAFLAEDTVFEDTSPAPDGRRIEGKVSVVDFWRATVRGRGSDRQRKSGHSAVGSIARCATASHGTCAALTYLPCAMEK